MSKIFKQLTKRETVGILNVEIPRSILQRPQKPSIYDIGGEKRVSSCLGCLNPRCMKFSPAELQIDTEQFADFPLDLNDSVCPLGAIIWEKDSLTPRIIQDQCINCGICARRCPFGAIFSKGEVAVIHSGEKEISFVEANMQNKEAQNTQIASLLECHHRGQYLIPSECSISNLYDRLDQINTEAQFPNLIVRNLFLVLGNRCIIRRRGDVYLRIDAIITDKSSVGIAEVDFHKDSLEGPRAILDDIAVLSSRYQISKDAIIPFIISLEFPSRRTEYWRVIKDISKVLKIKIHSLTLGALCVLVWSNMDVFISNVDFFADSSSPSIREKVLKHLGLTIGPSELAAASYAVFAPKR